MHPTTNSDRSQTPIQTAADDRFELLPRDLSAYRGGNTGIDYVHRFDSGRPGPQVLVNALTHGNELCGMVAVAHLLDAGVRPRIGSLTLSFAHVQAYQRFDTAAPLASRQIEHNLNRIWSDDWLDGPADSPELRRARELRPVVAAADHILDIHSTSQAVAPFWVYADFERNARIALAVGLPAVHLVLPDGMASGTPMIQHGRHAHRDAPGAALVVECGQHFKRCTGELAIEASLRFLAVLGLIEREAAGDSGDAFAKVPARRFALLDAPVIRTTDLRFARPLMGLESFAKDELIATDGADEIRAPCDDCTVFMPAREAVVGQEAVWLTQQI